MKRWALVEDSLDLESRLVHGVDCIWDWIGVSV